MKKRLVLFLMAGWLTALNTYGQGWIVGGSNAQQGQFPWVGDMRIASMYHQCGSALIAPQWVLTAAHCCVDGGVVTDTNALSFRFNSVRTNGPLNPDGGISRGVSKIFVHAQFSESEFFSTGYDIALIKLKEPVTSIEPIALPSLSDTTIVYATGYPVKIAGWGLSDTTSNYPSPDTMKFCSTKVFDHALCDAILGPLTQKAFCAGYKSGEEEAGAAQGDSGGPVWVENGNVKKIIGVVSGGINPWSIADTPGVFTKVALFRPWIDSVMQANGNTPTNIPERWTEEQIRIGTDHNTLHLYFGLVDAPQVVCDLYNVEGKKLYSTIVKQPSYRNYTLDLSGLPASMYIVRIHHSAGGQYFIKKVLKN